MDFTNEELLLLIGALVVAQRLHPMGSKIRADLDVLTDKLNDSLLSKETNQWD
jgi:hypothetical protein